MSNQTANGKCPRCSRQTLEQESGKPFRMGVPHLASLRHVVIEYGCPECGEGVIKQVIYLGSGVKGQVVYSLFLQEFDKKNSESKNVMLTSSSGSEVFSLQYPAVFRGSENELLPAFEGNVQDGTAIDRFGEPDLMAEFAKEYLRQFWNLMPSGRLPTSLSEFMPALLLLVTATELALKAYLIRSGIPLKRTHSLRELFEFLEPMHRKKIQETFAESDLCICLRELGVETPKIAQIMGKYSMTYGSGSSAYMDSRYYAEPTEFFSNSSGLKGANLLKSNTPYPIFLPDVARVLLEVYEYFSGPERLIRLGADLCKKVREPGSDNHGDWGLVPSSLGLIVIAVPQRAAKGTDGERLETFERFLRLHPTGFDTDWMYGGNTLLFFRDEGLPFQDGEQIQDGIELKIWSKKKLGMHTRDLYSLANALDYVGEGPEVFGVFNLRRKGIE